jgi:ribosomal protein S18 acetylase RimI-like enzyme
MQTLARPEETQAAPLDYAPVADHWAVQPLARGQEAETLAFLAVRPVHTVYMAGFIRDNGLVSPLNRGTFYGCRDGRGRLAGVALVGHVTQFEARTDAALRALAHAAQDCSAAHVIMGEQAAVRSFWEHYAPGGQTPRRACRELLLEQRWPVAPAAVPGLRLATMADLDLILPVQARMAEEECGVNPLAVDPQGFRARCALRVARGRIWVLVAAGRLLFKADAMAETPAAVYLEGIYVAAHERGRGLGRRCMLQLGGALLSPTRIICLLVHEWNGQAAGFYQAAGYKLRAIYDTIYLHRA